VTKVTKFDHVAGLIQLITRDQHVVLDHGWNMNLYWIIAVLL